MSAPDLPSLAQLAAQLSDELHDEHGIVEVIRAWSGAAEAGVGPAPEGAAAVGAGLWVRGSAVAVARAHQGAPVVQLALRALAQQRAAAEEEARYHALLEASFEGLCVHIDGLIVEVNPELLEIYGYTRDEMLGMHVSRLAAPEILPRIREVLSSGYSGSYETLAVRKDGSRVPLEARGKATTWHGQPARVAAFRDLRERKAAEAELVAAREAAQEATRTKSRFLANMSHEIRTPMNGVLGMVELLLDSPLAPDQRARARVIRSSAVHLLGLLNDILDLSRVEEGALCIAPEPVLLREVLDGALATVRASLEAKGLALVVNLARDLPAVWEVDPLRLRQVLVNLIGNAVRHTAQGRIGLTVARVDAGLRFRVSDTGAGMSSDQLDRLFERFASGARGEGGAGLGMSISHGLVESMGGHMAVASDEGEGTSVVFTVQARAVPTDPGPPHRVAVVGDYPELVHALSVAGATVRTFPAPDAPHLEHWTPALVFWGDAPPRPGPHVSAVTRGAGDDDRLRRVPDSVTAEELLRLLQPHGAPGEGPSDQAARLLQVLVVEDNVVNQLVVGEMLRRAGHLVEVVDNGQQGVEAALAGAHDLILMDVQMPVMDGLEATRQLRAAGLQTPIVALTAHAMAEDRAACRAAGMSGYLAKPVRVAALGQVLGQVGGRVPVLRGGG